MMINFALSLSVEGIELLHRVSRGWRRLGKTKISSTTLDADLTELRQKAIALAPEGFTTKLIIPRDQIKYTAIDTTMTTEDDVHAMLEGATPYSLDELVVDCERFGGRTHIAAVSRDTLQEAEAFAVAHGFRPVAFVGIPEPFTFQSEVFFGPTNAMPSILGANAIVERDALPVMIAGTRIKSRLLIMDDSQLYQDAETLADLTVDDDLSDAAQAHTHVNPDILPDADITPDNPVEIVSHDEAAAPAAVQTIWVDAILPEYRAHAQQKTEPVVKLPTPLIVPANPELANLPLLDAIIPEMYAKQKLSPVRQKPVLVATGPTTTATLAAPAAPRRTAAHARSRPAKPMLIAASVAAFLVAAGGLIWSQMPDDWVAQVEQASGETLITSPASEPVLESGPVIPEFNVTEFVAVPDDVLPEIALAPESPLISFVPNPIAQVPSDTLPLAIQGPPAPAEDIPPVVAENRPAPAIGTVLSPADATRIYEATGVWQRAARFIDQPSRIIAFEFEAPAGTTAPTRVAPPVTPEFDLLATELPFTAPADPPPPGVIFDRDENGFIKATPEGTPTPEGAIVFAGLPDLTITPRPTLAERDLNRMALFAPAPDGVNLIAGRPDFETPLRPGDLFIPELAENDTPDDVETAILSGGVGVAGLELQASGAVSLDPSIVEGRAADDVRPRLRPGVEETSVEVNAPDITDILEGIAAEDATLRFDSSTALAVKTSVRPDDRPNGFAATVAAVRERELTSQVAAVAAAIAPQAAPAPAPTPAPAPAAAPAPPQNTGPVPGGVARAATQEDAIRLRQINLIGVYGRPNARRALVRLSNGRYVRVEIGSELDGGQVTAIGDEALNYVKRGRTYAVEMPSG